MYSRRILSCRWQGRRISTGCVSREGARVSRELCAPGTRTGLLRLGGSGAARLALTVVHAMVARVRIWLHARAVTTVNTAMLAANILALLTARWSAGNTRRRAELPQSPAGPHVADHAGRLRGEIYGLEGALQGLGVGVAGLAGPPTFVQ